MAKIRRSLLIGINGYKPSIGILRFCVSDVKHIKAALNARRDGFDSTTCVLLTDEQENIQRPTKSNIIERISEVCDLASLEDTILIQFCGHGAIANNGRLYLLPIDATPISIEETAISWQWLRDKLEKSSAKNKIILLDACHSGAGKDAAASVRASYEILNAVERTTEGFVCIASCSGGQLSYELPEIEQGIFSHYIVEGILGAADPLERGVIEIQSLYNFVRQRTIAHAKRINVLQQPYLISKVEVPLEEITISAAPLDRPINRVLVLSEDPLLGNVLDTGIKMSTLVRDAQWVRDLNTVHDMMESMFNYDAVYVDVRHDWASKKAFIANTRQHYPIVPFVLVGVRSDFLESLEPADRNYGGYFFLDIETPFSVLQELIRDTLTKVEWDIRTRYGEKRTKT